MSSIGPSHEVSSQGVVSRDWLSSICAIDGPSLPPDESAGEEISAKGIFGLFLRLCAKILVNYF